jgi:hypothetical protein
MQKGNAVVVSCGSYDHRLLVIESAMKMRFARSHEKKKKRQESETLSPARGMPKGKKEE